MKHTTSPLSRGDERFRLLLPFRFKRLQAVAAPVLLGGLLLGFPTAPAHALFAGDMDRDNKITVQDAIMVMKIATGLEQAGPDDLETADIAPNPGVGPNAGKPWGDGKITVADAIALLRVATGIDPQPEKTIITPITFGELRRNVLTPSCTFSGCHSTASRAADLDLQSDDVYNNLVGHDSSNPDVTAKGLKRIVAGHSEQSFLLKKLRGPDADEGARMPKDNDPLSDTMLQRIKLWIDNGAPNNNSLTSAPPPDYSGDGVTKDVFLEPPPPGQGYQVVLGPFDVPRGGEVQKNFYRKLPVDEDVDVTRIEVLMNKGSHHLNIWWNPDVDLPDYVEDSFSALFFETWRLLMECQSTHIDWRLPKGIGMHLPAHTQLDFQSHYTNAWTQSTSLGRGLVYVNIWTAQKGEKVQPAGTMIAFNRDILLPPHQESSFTKTVTMPYDINIFALTGHFHSRGKQFKVWTEDQKVNKDLIYQSTLWDDPPFTTFDDGGVLVPKGEGLTFQADYYNPTDIPFQFGSHTDTNEHCILFVFFWPAPPDGKPLKFTGGQQNGAGG